MIAAAPDRAWADGADDGATRRERRQRAAIAFGFDGRAWNEEFALQRYELLYEAALVEEATRGGVSAIARSGARQIDDRRSPPHPGNGIARLRSKIKYRPVVFELMPPLFTLLQLQRTVEALAGRLVNKQNFRRLIEQQELVEETGETTADTGGRPAKLFRFRHAVLDERALGRHKIAACAGLTFLILTVSICHHYTHMDYNWRLDDAIRCLRAPHLYDRVRRVIPPIEWPVFADDIDAILALKRERNAVILAHNYQTPEIFHCVADIVGDSLALARKAMTVDADIIVLAGVHFMAETAKLLNPDKTVLIPDLDAGCSLADSITAEDVRLMRQRYPGVPVVTYVNTSAAVKAESDICCTSGNALAVVEVARRTARDHAAGRISGDRTSPPRPQSRSSPGKGIARCTSASPPADIRELRDTHPGVIVLAHPECPPEVVAEADFAGSTAAMSDYVAQRKPPRVVLMTECSMSDNVAVEHPEVEFIRPMQSLPAHEAHHARQHPLGP